MIPHNEDSRVKIPTILHLIQLGYEYLSLKGQEWDMETNIFRDIFISSMMRMNEGFTEEEARRVLDDISLELDNDDLGKVFYERLMERSGTRIIDFENFDNNSFHVVTELPSKKDDEEFRPDITLLINGMPLVFIEVKKPNNLDGTLAERRRMKTRFQNKKFKKFINITQFMVFSNNMEYDNEALDPIQGAFYSSTSYIKPVFNYFREEEEFDLKSILKPLTDAEENQVLKDNNLISIKNSPEFLTNKKSDGPTNRVCTSLMKRDRLKFILQYALAYVKETSGLQKHIMRYPQIFASKAIAQKLDEGITKGIIWHTQGSGKTALAYYNVKHLKDYFQSKNKVPKFYFIVDRLDLAIQAAREFRSRGLTVHEVASRDEFAKDIKSMSVIHNDSGKNEITVVNIHKFKDDPTVARNTDYNLNVQRIYFLDEVHRSYNPEGSFLANLKESDPNSIKIGLTGTPLIGTDHNSKALFGDYIHKYYYNMSIADGYTLKLIREAIETSYVMNMKKTLEEIKILQGNADRTAVYSHTKFVEPMLDYIITDFENSRMSLGDDSIGAMFICDSSNQAKEMMRIFSEKYALQENEQLSFAAEPRVAYGKKKQEERKVTSAAIILHDIGSKEERKEVIEQYKAGKIDILFVFNMLLTGFDAKRLKKLYLGRVVKAHNLLQALTRVNRTYKEFKYGYVVDFADIQTEFDKTNRAYFDELQSELGDEMQHYSDLFKSSEELEEEIVLIKEALWQFDTLNKEVFSQQISKIDKREDMLKITKALNLARSLYNLIRLSGNYDLLEKLDFRNLNVLSREANNHLALINTKEKLENAADTSNMLNEALEDVVFAFTKLSEEELILADKLKDILQRTREVLAGNKDQKDPEFVLLKDELARLFKKKNLSEVTKKEMEANIGALNGIWDRGKELQRKNELLRAKYANDAKYMRIHKRLSEKDPLSTSDMKLFKALEALKKEVDEHILQNAKQLDNEAYVEKMIQRLVIKTFREDSTIELNADSARRVNGLVVKEYLNEYLGRA